MKKISAVLMAVLFLGATGLVLADSSSPKLTKAVKHSKKGKKHKTALNPQPLPPAKIPVDGAQAGPGGVKPAQ
jgi:hypothetical protein